MFLGNCLFVGNEKTALHAMIDNVNFGGIGLYRKTPVPLNEKVRIQLKFLNKEGNTFLEEINGKIVQVTRWKKIYIIGIAFSWALTDKSHPHLMAYLREADRTESPR